MHLLYITTGTKEEALVLSEQLVLKNLVACANIIDGATSVYRWEGKLEKTTECIILAKTSQKCLNSAIKYVKETHSYDCPCVVSMPVDAGNEDFLKWVETMTEHDNM